LLLSSLLPALPPCPPLLPAGLNLMDHGDDVAGKEAVGREV